MVGDGLAVVAAEDIIDWAQCPLRYWWKHSDVVTEIVSPAGVVTAESLVKQSIKDGLKFYYATQDMEDTPVYTFPQSVAGIWYRWLQHWGVEFLVDSLVDYAEQRQAILDMFGKNRQFSKPDGNLYSRPMRTRQWTEQVAAKGLLELRKKIDASLDKVGIATLPISDDELYRGPMGLADAYATSMTMMDKLSLTLPDASNVVGAGVPVSADLLATRIITDAAIVYTQGKTSRLRGRPKSGDAGSQRKVLVYEIHIFQETFPALQDLARDIRILALRQSFPEGYSETNAVVKRVIVRHLQSGEMQDFFPTTGVNIDVLDSLAQAFLKGKRAGAYVPRLVSGWSACGECEYRPYCYGGDGVMAKFNPPIQSQISVNQKLVGDVKEFINKQCGPKKDPLHALCSFLEWMPTESPGISTGGALWLINSIRNSDSDEGDASV